MFKIGEAYSKGEGVEQSYEKAFECYTKAAESGDARAMYSLGVAYDNGDGIEQDYKKAFEWYAKAAELGHLGAMYNVGYDYYNGEGVEQSYEKAFEWYTKAAGLGDARAMCSIGYIYSKGEGVEQDENKAFEWYTKAAELGHAGAMFWMGLAYDNDEDGDEPDSDKAMEWYTKAAELGHVSAMFVVGVNYNNGEGVEQDYEKAFEWYTKAAELGHVGAMYNIGYTYDKGEGIEQDYEKAFEWYTKAAELGHVGAMYNVGYAHDNGEGVEQDYDKAFEWYTKAAELGSTIATYAIGAAYRMGQGVEESYEKAFEYYTKAAELGSVDAIYTIAYAYRTGEAVEQSYEKAFEYYTKAAELGYPSAVFSIGVAYDNGEGVEQNSEEAFEWYSKAAELGYERAMYNMGYAYDKGEGVEQDYEKAFDYYTQAAELGHAKAMYDIGVAYDKGKGVEQDSEKAVEWYAKAAELGYVKVNSVFTKEQVNKAVAKLGIQNLGDATIGQVVLLAQELEAETGLKFIRMDQGVPGFEPCKIGIEAEKQALDTGVAAIYPAAEGVVELKNEASRFIKAFIDIDLLPSGCIPVVGSVEGSFGAFIATTQCDPTKSKVLFIDPGFPIQKSQLKIFGTQWEQFDIFEHRGEKLREKLESYLAKGDIASIIYSNPNNPAWICLDETELKIIGELATKYDAIVIEDLAYFCMDFRKDLSHPFVAPYQASVARYTDNYILMLSGSKIFSYAGQRIAVLAIGDQLYSRVYPALASRYGTSGHFGATLTGSILYMITSGATHSTQFGLAAMMRAATDNQFNFVEATSGYATRAKRMKQLFEENGFNVVYQTDTNEQKVGDGFFFTIGRSGMSSGELMRKLIYYGITSITLTTTGSTQQGVRACTSRMSDDQFPVLEERLKLFAANH